MKIEKCFSLNYTPQPSSNNTTMGYFYDNYYNGSSRIFHSEEELKNQKNIINTILDSDGNGKIGKTLYVGKGSNVPRHKVKIFVEENKIKKTTIVESSDTVVFDKKIIKDVFDWFNGSKSKTVAIVLFTKEILDVVLNINKNYYKGKNGGWVNQFENTHIERYEKNYSLVIYQEEYNNYFPAELKKSIGKIEWINCYEQNSYRVKNIQEVFDTLQYYSKNPHGNIIWDDIILEKLNADGIDLDEDYINTLNSMFASNESDNIKLAIEMMANVNLDKHGLTIALLLNKWSGSMGWGNGNTSSQAYKTLDRYFKNKDINWKRDFRTFSTGLYRNYKNDERAKEIIEGFVLSNINNFLSENGFRLDDSCLQIDSFKISLNKK